MKVRILCLLPMCDGKISLDTLMIIHDALREQDIVQQVKDGKIDRYEGRFFTVEKNENGKVVFKRKTFPNIFTYEGVE